MKRFVLALAAVALAHRRVWIDGVVRSRELGGATCALDGWRSRLHRRHRARLRPPARPTREWGRIWDTLPSTSRRSLEHAHPRKRRRVRHRPRSLSRATSPGWWPDALVDQLAKNGFPTAGLGTPLEDGSYTLDATGSAPGCKVQATVKPMGGETFVTILYGAACPHD